MKQKEYELREYQRNSRINFFHVKRKLLHYTVSGGKTLTTLDIISSLETMGEVETVLVITPLMVGREVWEQEIEKFGFDFDCINLTNHTIDEGVELVTKNYADGKKVTITIINKDKLARFLWGHSKKIDERYVKLKKGVCDYKDFTGYDMVVVDESTMFKRGSKRTTAFMKFLRHYNPEYRLLLTGTPWTNDGSNIYYQYKILFEGDLKLKYPLGKTVKEFRNNYYNTYNISTGKKNAAGKTITRPEYELREGCKEAMALLLAPVTDVIDIDDVRKAVDETQRVGIQPPIVTKKILELPKNLKAEYNKIKKQEIITISNELDISISTDEELVFQMGSGNKGNKLRQFLSGFIYYNYEDAVVNDLPLELNNGKKMKKSYLLKPLLDIKIKALQDIIDERPDENLFVLFHYEAERIYLQQHFPDAVLLNSASSNEVVPRWNNKEIKLMIANPMSVSHGLNLQYGGSKWVWYTPTYSLEQYLQVNGRLPRPNQKHQTEMIQIMFRGTVDETVYDSIMSNKSDSEEWTQLIKSKKTNKVITYEDISI